jgi:hypothetical protein
MNMGLVSYSYTAKKKAAVIEGDMKKQRFGGTVF